MGCSNSKDALPTVGPTYNDGGRGTGPPRITPKKIDARVTAKLPPISEQRGGQTRYYNGSSNVGYDVLAFANVPMMPERFPPGTAY